MALRPCVRLLLLLAPLGLAACGDDSAGGKPGDKPAAKQPEKPAPPKAIDQSTPQALAEGIFAAAKSGDLALLAPVAAKDADGDSRSVAKAASAEAKQQAEFRAYFSTGKISGEVKIEGDKASVPILFGPDGTKPETLEMVKVDGRWYLQSF